MAVLQEIRGSQLREGGFLLTILFTVAMTIVFNLVYLFVFTLSGEGGNIVGSPLKGRVVIVDDVITAGTAIREAVEIIRAAGATPVGVALALDRQERGQGSLSAVQEVSSQFGLRCVSILSLADLIESLGGNAGDPVRISREQYAALQAYQQAWGAFGVSGAAGAGAQ